MSVQPVDAPAVSTQIGDHRITVIGGILRRGAARRTAAVVECPQWGDELNRPRPERPEFVRSA